MIISMYGELACRAARSLQRKNMAPTVAWRMHANEIFQHSPSSRKKSCPKEAFLGLAEAGLLNEVEVAIENRTKSSVNKDYAVKAYELICVDSSLINRPKKELWLKVIGDVQKVENQQIDVVIAL